MGLSKTVGNGKIEYWFWGGLLGSFSNSVAAPKRSETKRRVRIENMETVLEEKISVSVCLGQDDLNIIVTQRQTSVDLVEQKA